MRKTILVPTDFSVESLHVLKNVLSDSNEGDSFNVILLHGIYLNDSITDLMFFSERKMLKSLTNAEFEDACLIIKNKFDSKVNSIRKDLFTGFTQATFDNYVEANRIDEICISDNYSLVFNGKSSYDLGPFIKNSKVSVKAVPYQPQTALPERGRVAEIFYNGVHTQ